MVSYTNWSVGDTIRFCITVKDFCSTSPNFLTLGNFDIQKSGTLLTCDPWTYSCIPNSGIRVRIKSVKTYSPSSNDVKCSNLSGTIYRELGSALSDNNGIVIIERVVAEQDRTDYLNAISDGNYYDIVFCIDDPLANIDHAKVQYSVTISPAPVDLCTGVTCLEPICLNGKLYESKCDPTTGLCVADTTRLIADPCPSNYIDLIGTPWSWYDPNSAAQAMILKFNDINGAIINFFAKYGIIDYTYTTTRIFPKGDKVIVRVYLNAIGLSGMAVPLGAVIGLLLVIVGLIGIAIMSILDYFWGTTDQGFTNQQFEDAGEKFMKDLMDDCVATTCSDPTLTQDQKVECIKNCNISALTNWEDFKKKLFPDADHTTPLGTARTDIQICQDAYNVSPKSATDYQTFLDCAKIKRDTGIDGDKDNTLEVYPGDAPAGSKEKPTDWGKLLFYVGLGIVGLVIITRK